ncbi:MAG: ribbon-helix-helix protein, CopG family [Terriglobales bacterium]
MREAVDTKTGDLLPAHDLAGERPAKQTGRERAAARVAKYREKHGVTPMTVNIETELKKQFDEFLTRTGKSRAQVIEQALRTQVLRKR